MEDNGTDPRIRDVLVALAPKPGKRLWYGGASLFGSLRGVSAEQAAWHAAGLKNSIWQLMLHCAYSRYAIRRKLEGQRVQGDFPRVGGYWPRLRAEIHDRSWREDMALLRDQHQRLIEAITHFDPRRLDEHATQQFTYMDLLWGIVMHDVYHVGQLQLLKRLYVSQVSGNA